MKVHSFSHNFNASVSNDSHIWLIDVFYFGIRFLVTATILRFIIESLIHSVCVRYYPLWFVRQCCNFFCVALPFAFHISIWGSCFFFVLFYMNRVQAQWLFLFVYWIHVFRYTQKNFVVNGYEVAATVIVAEPSCFFFTKCGNEVTLFCGTTQHDAIDK